MMVPVWAVAAVLGRPEETIRTWAKTGRIASARDARTGQLVVDGAAATMVSETAARRKRSFGRAA